MKKEQRDMEREMVNKHFRDRGFLQSSGWDNNFMSAKLPSDFFSCLTIKVKLLPVTSKTLAQSSGHRQRPKSSILSQSTVLGGGAESA